MSTFALRIVSHLSVDAEPDDAKNRANRRKHGLDFADAPTVFAGQTLTSADVRHSSDEPRYLTVGMLSGRMVIIATAPRRRDSNHLDEEGQCAKERAIKSDLARVDKLRDEDIDYNDSAVALTPGRAATLPDADELRGVRDEAQLQANRPQRLRTGCCLRMAAERLITPPSRKGPMPSPRWRIAEPTNLRLKPEARPFAGEVSSVERHNRGKQASLRHPRPTHRRSSATAHRHSVFERRLSRMKWILHG